MSQRYLIASYAMDVDETPKISSGHMFNVKKDAAERFAEIAKRKIRSVVLYDRKTDEVVKLAIQGEPIYLVKAVELARGLHNQKTSVGKAVDYAKDYVKDHGEEETKKLIANKVIGAIAKALVGEAVPKIGDVVIAHFIGPYYALKGINVGVASTAGGLWGGLSGAIVGTIVGGPVGAFVGGIVGGSAAGIGAGAIVKSFEPPAASKKCSKCTGTGLVSDFRRCPQCNGYGYKKK